MVMVGDASHYERIARNGYHPASDGRPGESWAFFPLFPLLTRGGDFAISAMLLAIPVGTGAFMLHLQRVTGDALAFVHAQSLWGRARCDGRQA